jgi:hypothetical protein
VEVVSPDEDIFMKTREYLYNGVLEVWAVYPRSQELIIFNLDEENDLALTMCCEIAPFCPILRCPYAIYSRLGS